MFKSHLVCCKLSGYFSYFVVAHYVVKEKKPLSIIWVTVFFFQFIVCLLNLFLIFIELCRYFRFLCRLFIILRTILKFRDMFRNAFSIPRLENLFSPPLLRAYGFIFVWFKSDRYEIYRHMECGIEIQLYWFLVGRSFVPTLS